MTILLIPTALAASLTGLRVHQIYKKIRPGISTDSLSFYRISFSLKSDNVQLCNQEIYNFIVFTLEDLNFSYNLRQSYEEIVIDPTTLISVPRETRMLTTVLDIFGGKIYAF